MPIKNNMNAVLFLATLALSLISYFSMTSVIPNANASPNNTAKPMNFCFHNDTSNPWVGAYTRTIATLNTTQKWREKPQEYENIIGRLYLDFYVHPDLASNVSLDGEIWLHPWMCGYGTGGSTIGGVFSAVIYEITSTGQIPVGSTQSTGTQTLAFGSTPADSRDVNSVAGNDPLKLKFPTYTFRKGSSILIHIEVNPQGAGAKMFFYYDHGICPSYVTLYSNDYAQISSVKTYDVNYAETNLFGHNWTQSRRKVIVHANVTDPFGGYDIYKVNVTILDPSGQPVLDNIDMTRISDGLWLIRYLHTYEANWTYPENAMLGNYTAEVSVIDNNGCYHFLDYGTFDPYIEYSSHIFNIGIVILYNPSFKVVDDVDTPLPRVQVYIRLPNGTTNILPLYTDDNGVINLQRVPPGNYAFTILWKDVIVQQITQYVGSNGPYTIKCRVYQLTANVLGNNGVPVHGAYVVVYTHAGIVYDFKMTDSAGHAVFQLPSSDIQVIGSYTIEVHYSTTYWLTAVTATATKPLVSVTSSDSVTITLTGFPPSIWMTTGFWLLFVFMTTVVLGSIGFLYKRGVIFKGKA